MLNQKYDDIFTNDLNNTVQGFGNEFKALLVTGSAEPFMYVYLIGEKEGSYELLQKLEGHTDRVYSCDFHPKEPYLASGSADFTVKIWALSRKRAKG